MLALTRHACKAAFGIPTREGYRFSASARSDRHRDIDQPIMIERPHPRSADLAPT